MLTRCAILVGAFSAAVPAAATELQIAGDASCPAPARVAQRLALLVPEPTAGLRATLDRTPDGLRLQLLGPDGATLAQRVLPADKPCDALAEVASVVFATWLGALAPQSGTAGRLARPVEQPSPALLPQPPPPLPAPTPLPDTVPVGSFTPQTVLSDTDGSHPLHPNDWGIQLTAAALGSASGGGLAPGAFLQTETGPDAQRWKLQLSGLYDGPRQQAVAPGDVRWQRFAGAVGASYALTLAPVELDVSGDFTPSALHAQGRNFTSDLAQTAVDPGLDVGARLLLFRGQWRPWIGLWATGWLRQETLAIQNVPSSFSFPQLEVFAGVGLSFRTTCKVRSASGTSEPAGSNTCP